MLYTAVEEAPSAESVEPEVISRHFASFDEVFFTFCDRELKKINTFYSGERTLFTLYTYEPNRAYYPSKEILSDSRNSDEI